jgi:hypothetical protein
MSEFRPRFLRERSASQISPKIARSFPGSCPIFRDLACDQHDDADHLHLQGEAQRVEPGWGPRNDLKGLIEWHAEQMLDLSAVENCRQPCGRSATRGMYGKAMMLPSSRPCLRARFSGEPAIGFGMWPVPRASAWPGAEASAGFTRACEEEPSAAAMSSISEVRQSPLRRRSRLSAGL